MTRDAIRFVCVLKGWIDPTRSALIDSLLVGARRQDAERSVVSAKPLDVDTVRRIVEERPRPDVVALRGRAVLAASRFSSVSLGRLVRLPREGVSIKPDCAVLANDSLGFQVVLERHVDPDVCPVRALGLLLEEVPDVRYPLTVSRRPDGRLRFAETPDHDGTKHVVTPIRTQVKNAVFYASGSKVWGAARTISESEYELAAWRMDERLNTALRDESSLLLAWHAGMRRGELADLRVGSDLRLRDDSVEIRRQSRSGVTWLQTLYPSEDPRLCAVTALQRWARHAKLADGDFAFCRVSGGKLPRPNEPMGFEAWCRAWRRLADRCDVDPATLTALSPRRGFVNLANRAGASVPQIVSAVGPHSAEAVARQIRREVRPSSVAGRVGL